MNLRQRTGVRIDMLCARGSGWTKAAVLTGRPIRLLAGLLLGVLVFDAGHSAKASPDSAHTTVAVARHLPPAMRSGPYHTVEPLAVRVGTLYRYSLKTAHGTFSMLGTALLKVRIRELAALAAMGDTHTVGAFAKSLGASAAAPVRGAYGLLRRPGKTVRRAADSVKSSIQGIRDRLSGTARGYNPDGVFTRVSGVGEARRKTAIAYGIDPYTRFLPVRERLTRLARAQAAGRLTTRVGFAFAPGVAGIGISVGSRVDSLRRNLKDKSPRELNRLNGMALLELGVAQRAIDRFLANENLSPTDKTVIVAALGEVKGALEIGLFVEHAATAGGPDAAFGFRQQAEMVAAYHRKVLKVRRFVDLENTVAFAVRDGRLIVLLPADHLPWLPPVSLRLQQMMSARNRVAPNASADLFTSGSVGREAMKHLRAAGWRVRPRFKLQ